jgi:hypothetical protein
VVTLISTVKLAPGATVCTDGTALILAPEASTAFSLIATMPNTTRTIIPTLNNLIIILLTTLRHNFDGFHAVALYSTDLSFLASMQLP